MNPIEKKAGEEPASGSTASSASQAQGFWSPRSRHQLGIFGAGASFVFLSALLTRRSIYRRYKVTRPPFFHGNMTSLLEINGGLEALDALGIATINVFSYSIMWGGGLFWAFDISNLRELKQRIKMPLKLEEQAPVVPSEVDDAVSSWPAAALVMHEEETRKGSSRREG